MAAPTLFLPTDRQLPARDLLLWRTRLKEVENAVLPPNTRRPNPLVTEDLVVACVFSPGQIVALERNTGKLRWRVPLPYYGNSSALEVDGVIYGGAAKVLLAIDAATGSVLWEFEPYSSENERMYALPTVAGGRLFVGDRRGRLHAIAVDTGKRLWSLLTSRAENRQVNATPTVWHDRVVGASNARMAFAVECATGRKIWKTPLDAGSIYEVVPFGEVMLVRTLESIYGIAPESGEIVHRWHWPDEEIRAMEVAGGVLFTVRTRDYRVRDRPPGEPHRRSGDFLAAERDGKELWRIPYPLYLSGNPRWDESTGYLLEGTEVGLGIVDPTSGTRTLQVFGFARRRAGGNDDGIGIPGSWNDKIYVMTRNGTVCALRGEPFQQEDVRGFQSGAG